MNALLFFDDWCLESHSNIERKMGRPKWIEEATFTDPRCPGPGIYPSVFWDPHLSRWRAFYHAVLQEHMGTDMWSLATAESDDGVHWHVPDLNEHHPDPERRQPNEVFPAARGTERGMVYLDQRETDPDRRYKLMYLPGTYKDYMEGKGLHRIAFSSDGYRWRPAAGVTWGAWLSDGAHTIFYNQHRDSYVTVCRPSWGDRRVGLIETRDWLSWSRPVIAVHPDPLDEPLVQFYGMPTFPYEGMYVAFLWIMHCDPHEIRGGKHAGPVDSQLAYSYDGWHFNRTFRRPLIPRSEPGIPGCGRLQSTSLCVDDEHVIRIYSNAALMEHHRPLDEREKRALLLHTLRLDGFMYLESTSNLARVTTRCLLFEEPLLRINVQAPLGEVRVQLSDKDGKPLEGLSFADCIPFRGDSLFWEPQWQGGKSLRDAQNVPVRVEVEMYQSRLYAIRGAFNPFDLMTYIRRAATTVS